MATPKAGAKLTCQGCGKQTVPSGNAQKYCAACRRRSEDIAGHMRKCPGCGAQYYASKIRGSSSRRKFCSIQCRQRANGRVPKKPDYPLRKCEQCEKEYPPVSTQQKYCSQKCQDKHDYLANIDRHRERDRVKIRKQTLGLNIRDEHLQTPTRIAKWLWDGVGRWSPKHEDIDRCLECGTNTYRHAGNGVCEYCYDKLKWRDEERLKAYKRMAYQRQRDAGKKFSRKESKEWIDKASGGEIPVTPKIANILTNLQAMKKLR